MVVTNSGADCDNALQDAFYIGYFNILRIQAVITNSFKTVNDETH